MCSCDSAEDPQFHQVLHVKARKKRKCCECGRPILPGQHFRQIRGKWDGYIDVFETCYSCVEVAEAYNKASGDDCNPPFCELMSCIRTMTKDEPDFKEAFKLFLRDARSRRAAA